MFHLIKALMLSLTKVPVPHRAKIPLMSIRVARLLLLALSLDVTATDDEARRAFSTGSSSFAIPNVSLATGPPKEMACSARRVNGPGRVLHPSVAAVETGPNGRAPFSSTRALAGLAAGCTSFAKNEMQGVRDA